MKKAEAPGAVCQPVREGAAQHPGRGRVSRGVGAGDLRGDQVGRAAGGAASRHEVVDHVRGLVRVAPPVRHPEPRRTGACVMTTPSMSVIDDKGTAKLLLDPYAGAVSAEVLPAGGSDHRALRVTLQS